MGGGGGTQEGEGAVPSAAFETGGGHGHEVMVYLNDAYLNVGNCGECERVLWEM